MDEQVSVAARIIDSNRYLTLGSASDRHGSWVSPLAFTVEPDFSFIFYSASASRHCRNLAHDPRVAGAIFDSVAPSDTADGVQFSGLASEVPSQDLSAVMDRYFALSFPDPTIRARWIRPPDDFKGGAPQRFYRIRINDIYKPDPTSTKVDRRIKLDLHRVAEVYRNLRK